MSKQHSIESANCGSVKELQQWLSKFGDCNREHYSWSSGLMKKKNPREDRLSTEETKILAIPYAMRIGKGGGRPDPTKSISTNSSQSTSVASPPQPIRTNDGSVFEPKSELPTKTSTIPTRYAQQQRPTTEPTAKEAMVSTSESLVMLPDTASDDVTEWHVSDMNENERVRIIARSAPYAAASTTPIEPNVKIAEPTTSSPSFDPTNDVVDEIFQSDLALPGIIRRKVPLLFCKSRRESKELLAPVQQTKVKTVMVPTTTKHSSGCPAKGLSAKKVARTPTEAAFTEAQDNDSYFQFDEYWNDSSMGDSSDLRVREAFPQEMKSISTSLVHVFEKEVALEMSDSQSPWTEIEAPTLNGRGPDSSMERGFSSCDSPAQTGSHDAPAKSRMSDLPAKSRPHDIADSTIISSKHSRLKVMTPPRSEISQKIEQFGGRMKPRKLSSVQSRMAELEKKWAESKQVEHSKAIKWEALNGAYKKRIFLEQKGLP